MVDHETTLGEIGQILAVNRGKRNKYGQVCWNAFLYSFGVGFFSVLLLHIKIKTFRAYAFLQIVFCASV